MGAIQINTRGEHLNGNTGVIAAVMLAFGLSMAGGGMFAQSTARLFHRLNIYHPEAPAFVTAITQDQHGFIWVGSPAGLYRFDGYQFKAVQQDPADSSNAHLSNITTLYTDKTGIIWIGSVGAVHYIDQKTGIVRQPAFDETSVRVLAESSVRGILEDESGRIWIATGQHGLLRYDPALRKTRSYHLQDNDTTSKWPDAVWAIAKDPAGTLWIATSHGIRQYDPNNDRFVIPPGEQTEGDQKKYSLGENARGLTATGPGELWAISDGKGLYHRDPATGMWSSFAYQPDDPESLGDNRAIKVYKDRKNQVWIGTVNGGLNRYDAERGAFIRYQTAAAEINSISDNHIYEIFEDRNGLLWVGTARGVDILKPGNTRFEFYQREPGKRNTLSGDNVLALWEDSDGEVWIGTRGAGLNRYNPGTKNFRTYRYQGSDPGSLGDDLVWSIHRDRKRRLWVGTSKGTLNLFDPNTERFKRFWLPGFREETFSDEIRSITEDERGVLWLATLGSGLYAFDPEAGSFEWFSHEEGDEKSLSGNAVYDLQADGNGGLWVATLVDGICYYDIKRKSFTRYVSGQKRSPNHGYDDVFSVFIDRRKRVWTGTANGRLGLFDPVKNKFSYFLEDIPEGSFSLMGIADDQRGNLWLLTTRGLLRFTPPEDLSAPDAVSAIQRYTTEDGLQDNDFDTGAVFQGRNGYLYIGGRKGYNRFHPDSMYVGQTGPDVMLTDFQIFNRSVSVAGDDDRSSDEFLLEQDIACTESITLAHDQRVFSIEFTAVDFADASNNRYAYRMEGFTPDWVDIGTQHAVTFTNLDPGAYTLQVKAANAAGIWGEKVRTLKVVIIPPWYMTWPAWLTFGLIIIGAVYGVYQFNLKRRLHQAEAARVLEMDVLKTRLYTNITHEFRTPLTVIMGMNENIKGHEQEKKLIRRNGTNLLRLVNQLLDLSKLDAGKLRLNPIQADIISYLQYLNESFYSIAAEKRIRLTFYSEEDALVMDFDEDKIQQIIYNLLSNALKFTPTGGKVIFHVQVAESTDGPQLKMKIKDTGPGIPQDQLPHIFDRFYQADNSDTRKGEGTGIGLTLTRDLVELMGGQIQADSTIGKGSEFVIWLPITREASIETINALAVGKMAPARDEWSVDETIAPDDPASGSDPEDRPELLIIEDNADVVTYIRTLLEKDYFIHTAPNGQIGIEKAIERVPDIIISDVMMPEKNGYEVCQTLKSDERTSHIPIILLTAKSAQEDRVRGLKYGADAVLVKPFDKTELMIRLEKLVELRRQLQHRYTANQGFQPGDAPLQRDMVLEDTFLVKLQTTIKEHIADAEFGVPQLARTVMMSQMQVYRKLKALTGQTPSQFIRSVRLHKGKELLKSTDLTISEIAYSVGFSDPNYFSRMFQQTFGGTPKDFRNQLNIK